MADETQDGFRIKEGGVRLLTAGEIQLAQSVFYPPLIIRKYGYTEKVISLSIYRITIRR